MQLNDIIHQLLTTSSREDFDEWVSSNIEQLTECFYGLSLEDLKRLRFDTDFYSGVFVKSAIFKEFEKTREYSEPFNAFLLLIASASEKLAEHFNITGPMDHILSYLPESSIKFRLKALSRSQDIDDVRTDYIRLFPQILQLLEKAETTEEETQTKKLVEFLIFYFKKAENILTDKGYDSELEVLKSKFTSKVNKRKYHFLDHQTVQEVVTGHYHFDLHFENLKLPILYPSEIVENLFRYNINQLVLLHSRSNGNQVFMGYDKLTVLNDILERGKTNFDVKYNNLEPRDKVLLYCYFNMKKHFFTSVAIYQKMWQTLSKIFNNGTYSPIFIDLGCGPLTSGLALGEVYHRKTKKSIRLNYIGICISDTMLKKAKEFSKTELFDSKSTFNFYKNWNNIEFKDIEKYAGKYDPIIINASYLFANLNSNVVDDLANFIRKLVSKFNNVHFIFQNPNRIERNINWVRFKKQLKFKSIHPEKNVENVLYKTSRHSLYEPGNEDVYYEILTIKAE